MLMDDNESTPGDDHHSHTYICTVLIRSNVPEEDRSDAGDCVCTHAHTRTHTHTHTHTEVRGDHRHTMD